MDRSALCDCFEIMREVSRNGFIVEVRSTADRPEPLGVSHDWTCEGCAIRYVLTPTRAWLAVA